MYWLVCAGRGFGKTRTGAEWVRWRVETQHARRIALVSDTAADVRDVMIEGPDGILNICPPWNRPIYEPSKRRLTWPNGTRAIAYAAEAPELLRGPQHDTGWCDEFTKWKNLRKRDREGGTAFDNLLMGLRVGVPQCCLTFTPRPVPQLRDLLAKSSAVITRGTSYENRENLSEKWFEDVILGSYEGTRLGRQEIHAELLEDVEGALWKQIWIDNSRVQHHPELHRVVIAIDIATTSKATSNETGIIAVGLGPDRHAYILEDASDRYTPDRWARKSIDLYKKWNADRVVAEANQGGDLIRHTLHTVDSNLPVALIHATKGKKTRAEPISALYQRTQEGKDSKVHHVGTFPTLEDQMRTWVPLLDDDSPDRLDALVWGVSFLLNIGSTSFGASNFSYVEGY